MKSKPKELFENMPATGSMFYKSRELEQDLSSDYGPPGGTEHVVIIITASDVWRKIVTVFNGFGGPVDPWQKLSVSVTDAKKLVVQNSWTEISK